MRSLGLVTDQPVSGLTQNGTMVEQIAKRHGSTTVKTIGAAPLARSIAPTPRSDAASCVSPISIVAHSIDWAATKLLFGDRLAKFFLHLTR